MRSSLYQWPEQKRGADNPQARFTRDQVENLRDRHQMGGVTIRQLAQETGAGETTIRRIVRGERYNENG
jgi:hypothetical protein